MNVETNRQKAVQNAFNLKRDSVLLVPIAICIFLFLTSVMATPLNLSVFDGKRIVQIGLIPAILLFALIHPALRRTTAQLILQTPLFIKVGLLVIFAIGFISSMRFPHPGYSLLEVSILFCLISTIYIVASSRIVATHRFDKLIMAMLVATAVVVAMQELMGLLANMAIGIEFSYDNMFIYFSHPRFSNQVQTWLIPVLAAIPFVFRPSRPIVLMTTLLLGCQWYLLFVSGARGSIVSIVSAMIIMLILVRSHGKPLIKLQSAGALLGAFLYYIVLLVQQPPGASSKFIAESIGRDMTNTTGRTTFWQYAWNDALASPVLGAGPGRFACQAEIALPSHPHNFAMQILSEWGFPAAILLIGLAIYIAWLLVRSVYPTAKNYSGVSPLRLSLLTALLAAVVHSSVSGIFVMPASHMLGTLLCGWLLATAASPIKPASLSLRPNTLPLTYSLLIASFLISSLMLTFSALEIQKFGLRFEQFGSTERLMPRFWNRGRICRYSYEDTATNK